MGNMAALGILLFMATIMFAVAEEPDSSLAFRMPQYTKTLKDLNLKRIAVANNDLGVDLYKYLAEVSKENLIFSPFSISTLFSMLYMGAKSSTANELRWLLGFSTQRSTLSMNDQDIFATYRIFLTEVLEKLNSTSYAVNYASTVLVDKSFPLLPFYKGKVQNYFEAFVEDVNFAADFVDIKKNLDSWTSENTGGLITELVDFVDPSTILLAASAAYFKAMWDVKFDPKKTKYQPFYNGGRRSDAKNVPMMHIKSMYHFYVDDDDQDKFTAVEVPYEGKNMSMLVILPEFDDGLADVEKDLTVEKILHIRRHLSYGKVHLTMPKFKVEFGDDLIPYVEDLGMDILTTPRSDFSGMTTVKANRRFRLDEVRHKAVIDVNEEGTTAAGVTMTMLWKTLDTRNDYEEFKLDHPFIFMIIENRSNMILFMGRVNNL